MLAILKFLWKKTAATAACAFTAVSLAVISLPFFLPLADFSFAGYGGEKGGAEREYALYSATSSAAFDTDPSIYEALFIKGETVIFRTKIRRKAKKSKKRRSENTKPRYVLPKRRKGKRRIIVIRRKSGRRKQRRSAGRRSICISLRAKGRCGSARPSFAADIEKRTAKRDKNAARYVRRKTAKTEKIKNRISPCIKIKKSVDNLHTETKKES